MARRELTTKGGHTQHDFISQSVVCHVGFLLGHFVPQRLVLRWLERQRRSLGETFQHPEACLLPVGSFRDGLNIPDVLPRHVLSAKSKSDGRQTLYDADLLYTIDLEAGTAEEGAGCIIDSSDSYPGYFQIVLGNDTSETKVGVEELFNSLKQQYAKKNWSENDVDRQGPALNFKDDTTNIDLVPMGKCMSWPPEAKSWLNRVPLSGWPPVKLRAELISSACHFVFKPHKSSRKPSTECRFSFVIAELVLTSTLSKAQRQCYVTFKTLVRYVLPKDSAISSYCLKTTLFWTLERIPQSVWDDPIHGLGRCFLEMLNMLIHFLVNGNLPQYFIPDNNLIGHFDRLAIKDLIPTLSTLRTDPIALLFEYNTKYRSCNETRNLDVISTMLPGTATEYKLATGREPTEIEQCLQLHQEDRVTYFSHAVKAENFACAINALEDLGFFSGFGGTTRIDPIEFVLNRMSQATGRERDFLGKLCLVMSLKCDDHISNKQRAKVVIRTVKNTQSMSFELGVYSVLYYVCCSEEHEATITLNCLTLLLHKNRNKTLRQAYCEELIPHLDDVMKLIFSDSGSPQISLGSLIYYQMIRLYMRSNTAFLADEVALEFEDFSKSEPEGSRKCCYTLLAFGFMYVQQYWKAALAFEKIIAKRRLEISSILDVEELDTVIWVHRGRANLCKLMAIYQIYKKNVQLEIENISKVICIR